jgi:site-specific DNA-cytosine methylase
MHNYPIKNSFKGKLENWELLNAKVLRSPKIRCELTREEMSAVARSEKDAAERVLLKIKTAVEDDFMSLDHPDERDGDREEEEEEEESNSETDEYEIEEEEEQEQEQEQYTHKQRLAQSAANDDEKNDDEKEKEDKEETKTTTTTTKLLSLKEATIKEEEEEKKHPRKSSLLSSSVIKEKDEAISRLTVKVDALTAKCAKLEQLLELTKRKTILLFRVAQGRAPRKGKILSFPSEKNENKDAYYHIIVLKDEGSIHDFNGLVHRLLRRGLLSLRGWDYHVEQIHFIGHAVPFSNRPLVLRSRVWMGDDGVAV